MPFDFQSVGGNMAMALQKHLDEQRELQRRTMLDALNQKNVESEIAARGENTKSMSEQRQAASDAHRLTLLQQGLRPGDTLDPSLSSEDTALLTRAGLAHKTQGTVETGEAVQDPNTGEWSQKEGTGSATTAPPKLLYGGTNADRQGLERQAALRMLAQDKSVDPQIQNYLKIMLEGGDLDKGLSSMPAALFERDKQDTTYDPVDNTYKPAIDITGKPVMSKTGAVHMRSRPPVPPTNTYTPWGIDANGNLVGVGNRNGAVITPLDANGNPVKPKPTSSSTAPNKYGVTPQMVSTVISAAKAIPIAASSQGLKEAQDNLNRAQNQIASKLPTPETRRFGASIILPKRDKQGKIVDPKTQNIDDLIKASDVDWTDDEIQALREMLPLILGKITTDGGQ